LIGYEVEGLEHIPAEGPVLIVFYHGALPIDFYYLFAKIWLYRNRRVRVVADKFVFKIPGMIYNYRIEEKHCFVRSWHSS
jgi:1-acyl-sn-glycerol-3-phosphate acyltransferase